jgi:hypothetical protein
VLEADEGEGVLDAIDVVPFGFQVRNQDFEDLVWHFLVDLYSDDVAEAALADGFFDGFEEIVGFEFLDGDVGVAGDVEGVGFENLHAREEIVEVGDDELFKPDEALGLGAAGLAVGLDGDELREGVWNLEAGEVIFALIALDEDGEVEAQV